jgi:hypothetical protein
VAAQDGQVHGVSAAAASLGLEEKMAARPPFLPIVAVDFPGLPPACRVARRRAAVEY